MKCAVALLLFAVIPAAAAAGSSDPLSSLPAHAAVLWVGAHSDDEAIVAGALLARLARTGRPVFILTLTRGEGTGVRGAEDDEGIAKVRRREFCLACTLYRARDCDSESFPSRAHLDATGNGFAETSDQVIALWRRDLPEDPVRTILRTIRRLRPAWILTLDPDHGMYGHPEHMAAARLTLEAVRGAGRSGPRRVFSAENRLASITPGRLDPGPVTLRIPADTSCGFRRTCWQIQAEAMDTYASQALPDIRHAPVSERFTFLRQLWPPPSPRPGAPR